MANNDNDNDNHQQDGIDADADTDALAKRIQDKLVELNGASAQSPMAKQGIQLLLASGLLELYKERQLSQSSLSQSQPTSPNPAISSSTAPLVQSPMAVYSDASASASPMSSISSAASGSSYGLPSISQSNRPREATGSTASASSTSQYSPSTSHTRSFSASSASASTPLTSSPSLSSTSTSASSSLRRSNTRKPPPLLKILDLATGEFGTITTLLTLMSWEKIILPIQELEITASETEKSLIEKVKVRFKGWNHVKLRAFAPESIQATADTYNFVFLNMGMHWVRDEDSTLHEIQRVLQPGGTAGFATFQSIGYTSSGPEDPLKVLPNSGWSSALSIHKKLTKHNFTDIQIYEYTYSHSWESGPRTSKQVIEFIIDHAIKKLWKDENDQEMDLETKCSMRDQLMNMFQNGDCKGDITALIALAKKPVTQVGSSYF